MNRRDAGDTTVQVLLALECLHSNSIAYRDLKPENTLISLDGHVLLADFGVSKILGRRIADSEPSDSAQTVDRHPRPSRSMLTLVGTREYMAPEYFRGGGYTPAVDFWALAVMLYEMLTGDVPRQPGGEALWSTAGEPILDCDSLSAGAADLLRRMLTVDLSGRLGAGRAGVTDIKAHGFFTNCDWEVRRDRAEIALRSRRDRTEISPLPRVNRRYFGRSCAGPSLPDSRHHKSLCRHRPPRRASFETEGRRNEGTRLSSR